MDLPPKLLRGASDIGNPRILSLWLPLKDPIKGRLCSITVFITFYTTLLTRCQKHKDKKQVNDFIPNGLRKIPKAREREISQRQKTCFGFVLTWRCSRIQYVDPANLRRNWSHTRHRPSIWISCRHRSRLVWSAVAYCRHRTHVSKANFCYRTNC